MDEDIRKEHRADEPDSADAESGLNRLDSMNGLDKLDRVNRRTFIKVSALAGMAGAAGAAGIAASGCDSAGEMDGSSGDGNPGGAGGTGGSGGAQATSGGAQATSGGAQATSGGAGDSAGGLTSAGGDPDAIAADLRDNVYTRLLGVRPHVGAHEHLSSMGGSRMPAEVMAAMTEANRYFVDMAELHDAAGRRIAEIMGAEAALVSSGAFATMLVGAAGVLTGSDEERMRLLPNPTWPKVECLFQTAHRFFYDNVFGLAGMKLVEAGTRAEYEAAITDRTALLVGLAYIEHQTRGVPPFPVRHRQEHDPETLMPLEIIEIGRRRGVPVMIDLASNLPPKENLTRYLEAGADLVVVSGGKGIRGPNSTGILAGRADLIEAARMQNAPNNGIGTGAEGRQGGDRRPGRRAGAVRGPRRGRGDRRLEREGPLAGGSAAGHRRPGSPLRAQHPRLPRRGTALGRGGDSPVPGRRGPALARGRPEDHLRRSGSAHAAARGRRSRTRGPQAAGTVHHGKLKDCRKEGHGRRKAERKRRAWRSAGR